MIQDKEELKKLFKKGLAVLLSCTMVGTMFVGCSKQKDTMLEDTILYKAQVMTVDRDPIIVTPTSTISTRGSNYCYRGSHYKDVVTGTVYHVLNFTTEEAQLMIENSQKKETLRMKM